MELYRVIWAVIVLYIYGLLGCRKPQDFADNNYDNRFSGGLATNFSMNADAFGTAIDNLSALDQRIHELGDRAFENVFVTAPAPINEGLGTLYNNVSCANCHHADAKGIPTLGETNSAMLMRVSMGNNPKTGPVAVPGFGTQIQDKAIAGKNPEAKFQIIYENINGSFDDGEKYTLTKPKYQLIYSYLSIPNGVAFSPRLAPSVFGLGLLETIDEQTILINVDENDRDRDGISGKANYVYDVYLKKTMIGRFGLKANTATLLTQIAEAYNQDMGITNFVSPIENSFGQIQYSFYKDIYEIADTILKANVFYIRTLSVPARRNVQDPNIIEGQTIFNQINCSKCHIPFMNTGLSSTLPQLSNQRIQPFTDLLLHDMGEELSDNKADFLADAAEWRTPPLWGIGLLKRVNGLEVYLHDGRAKTLQEAILWHGGEAEMSKQNFKKLQKTQREKLIKFLQSL